MNNPFKSSGMNNEEVLEENKPEEISENNEDVVTPENKEEIKNDTREEVPANAELDKIKADYEQLNNQYLRLAADFENYRKRQEIERENLIKYGAADALKKLIEVLDNFDRGEKALEKVEDCQVVKENFNLLHKQTLDVLSKLGLEPIETEGKEFDPNFHEAVMQTPTSEHPEHTIVNELQKGYKFGDKVLRPSLVNVAVAE